MKIGIVIIILISFSYGKWTSVMGSGGGPITQSQACEQAERDAIKQAVKIIHGVSSISEIRKVIEVNTSKNLASKQMQYRSFQSSKGGVKLKEDFKKQQPFCRNDYHSTYCECNVTGYFKDIDDNSIEEKEPEPKKPHQKGDFLITVGGGQGFYQESKESYKYSNRELDFHWNYLKFGFGEFDFENERRDAKAKNYTYFLFGLGFHQLRNSFIYGISFDGVFPNQRKNYFPQASIFAGIFPISDTPLFLALSLALQIREEVETQTMLKLGVVF
jgi:hypothetical protein